MPWLRASSPRSRTSSYTAARGHLGLSYALRRSSTSRASTIAADCIPLSATRPHPKSKTTTTRPVPHNRVSTKSREFYVGDHDHGHDHDHDHEYAHGW